MSEVRYLGHIKSRFLFLLVLFELATACSINGQATLTQGKEDLSSEDYHQWEEMHLEKVSGDGAWVSYNMDWTTLYLKNTKDGRTYKIPDYSHPKSGFSSKDNCFAYKVQGEDNHIGYIDLRNGEQTKVKKGVDYMFSPNGRFLVVHTKAQMESETQQSNLIIKDLESGTSTTIPNVTEFGFHGQGASLVFLAKKESEYVVGLTSLDKDGKSIKFLCRNQEHPYKRLVFDRKGKAFSFMEPFGPLVEQAHTMAQNNRVHFYTKNTLATFDPSQSPRFPDGMYVSSNPYGDNKFIISNDSEKVFFSTAVWPNGNEGRLESNSSKKSSVEIWTSQDNEVYPKLQGKLLDRPLLSFWNPKTNTFLTIEDKNQRVLSVGNDHALVFDPWQYRPLLNYGDDFMDVYIIELKTGKKTLLIEKQARGRDYTLISPSKKYMSYFRDKNWWVYDIYKKTHTNITKRLPSPTYQVNNKDTRSPVPYGNPGWTLNDKSILIYDKYDIWLIAPDGSSHKKLTNGYDSKIKHTLYKGSYTIKASASLHDNYGYDFQNGLLLNLYGERTKKTGFALCSTKKGVHNIVYNQNYIDEVKRVWNKEIFFGREQRFDMPPKICLYQESKPKELVLSNPQHFNYHWGKSELIEYKGIHNDTLQGALFYPANYDPSKKYPMVVKIYEKLSYQVNMYKNPSLKEGGGFNHTHYTLNDYFMLLPDIEYEYNQPGISAAKCVVSAVNKVLEMGMVDKDKVGLTGHSFGGYETVFILTQTDLFSAGVAGSPGRMDILSSYLSFYLYVESEAEFFETAQQRFTGSYWDYTDAYLQNSPIHNLEKLNTPLLSWHGKKDPRVDFKQGIELYNAMRRLNKEHVFLAYPQGGHVFTDSIDQMDLSNRIMDWFDEKLKK